MNVINYIAKIARVIHKTATLSVSKALSITALLDKKYSTLSLSKEWHEAFEAPEDRGVWFIYGHTGNGKTSFLWQLIKELSQHGRVAFNSLEEGFDKTVQSAVSRASLTTAERKRILIINESIEELTERIQRQKSPKFIIIDSFQYTGLDWKQYLKLKQFAAAKLLIVVSHAEGKLPQGRTANRVMYDASLKIWIEGFRAFSKGRYIGSRGYFDIWPEQAALHWGTTNQKDT